MTTELPETLIHRVQSFLTRKQAAQTALLSKSWCSAWSTRPTIDIDHSHVPEHRYHSSSSNDTDELAEFAKNTFRRYEESNLSIDTFILCLNDNTYARFGLAEEWTSKALKLGATDLTFRLHNGNMAIPLTEVSASENVTRLCLQGLNIDRLKVINCTGLKSLTLTDLTIRTDQFLDELSRFPLIEYLSLSDTRLPDTRCRGYQRQVVTTTSIILHKLRSLVLSRFQSQLQMKTLFLDDLSSKFPNLKDLSLGLNLPYEHSYLTDEIRNISSLTLETVNLSYLDDRYYTTVKRERVPRVKLDVPSIRKFTFEASCMPNLYFSPTQGDQLHSHVSIKNCRDLSTMWFCHLSESLRKLKGSKIHLCLHLRFDKSFDYEVGEIDGLNVFEVDDLTLDIKHLPSFSCYAVLDGLFRICHPKMITQYVGPSVAVNDYEIVLDDDSGNNRNNDLFICRALELGMQVKNVLLPAQFMYGLRDLEELDAQQLFNGVWKSQPLSSILDDSTSEQRRFRFHLKWKPSLNQFMTCPDDDDDDDDDDNDDDGDDDDVDDDDDDDDDWSW